MTSNVWGSKGHGLNHLGTTFSPLFSCVKAAEAASQGTALQQVAQPMRRFSMRELLRMMRWISHGMSPFPKRNQVFSLRHQHGNIITNGPCGCKMFFLLKMRDISGKAMLGGKKSLNQNSSNFQPRKPWGFFVVCFFV